MQSELDKLNISWNQNIAAFIIRPIIHLNTAVAARYRLMQFVCKM